MEKTIIVIEIQGGMISQIHRNKANVTVEVIDWDVIKECHADLNAEEMDGFLIQEIGIKAFEVYKHQ